MKYTEAFEAFWAAYPQGRKTNKKGAFAKWQALKLEQDIVLRKQIMANVEVRAQRDKQWLGGFAPMPTTYLNQARWEDDWEERPQGKGPVAMQPKTRQRANMVPEMSHAATVANMMFLDVCHRCGGVSKRSLAEMIRQKNELLAYYPGDRRLTREEVQEFSDSLRTQWRGTVRKYGTAVLENGEVL